MYKSRGNPDVQTYICVPPTFEFATKIVVVMAGQQRDADAYLEFMDRVGVAQRLYRPGAPI